MSVAPRSPRIRLAALALALLGAVAPGARDASGGPAEAQQVDPVKEYRVKAACLANFVKYTEWPEEAFASPRSPLVAVIVGPNPHADLIEEALRARKYGEHPIQVVRSAVLEREAHFVFVTGVGPRGRAAVLRNTAGKPALIVGEAAGFASKGAGLNFYLERGKVRFEANPVALREAGLRVSSELLKLARVVPPEDGR